MIQPVGYHTSVVEDLNSGLSRTNPASNQGRTWTRASLRITSPAHHLLDYAVSRGDAVNAAHHRKKKQQQWRPLDSRTRTTTSARFELKFFRVFSKYRPPRKALFYHFSLEKLALLSLVDEVRGSPDRKMIKLLTFDILFSPPRHSRENSYHVSPPKWRLFTRVV